MCDVKGGMPECCQSYLRTVKEWFAAWRCFECLACGTAWLFDGGDWHKRSKGANNGANE